MTALSRVWFAVSDWVWPRACLVCDAPMNDPATACLCPKCETALTTDPHPTCPRCSSTVGPHTDLSAGCPRCRNERYQFTAVTRFGPYDGALRDAILRTKQPGGEPLAEVLGMAFAKNKRDQLLACAPEVVVSVPLHWRRRLTRGHNQAEGIARGIAVTLELPLAIRTLRRVRPTPKQTAVSAEERRRNVGGAFWPRTFAAVRGLRVLLIDDVLTTGATASEAAGALRSAGAAQVHVAVVAHR